MIEVASIHIITDQIELLIPRRLTQIGAGERPEIRTTSNAIAIDRLTSRRPYVELMTVLTP